MSPRRKLLVSLPVGTRLNAGHPRKVIDLARRTEGAGADGVVLADHVSIGPRLDRYEWGKFPFGPEAPWLEPMTMLTAMATVTERITLTTGILIVPLRPAALLAKIAATLDVLSNGRLELGVGTGWQQEELEAQGLDYRARGQLLTDFIGACRALWRDSPAAFSSPSVTFSDIWSEPKPVQRGGPPILFSGTLTKRNRDRIVQLGDGWIPIMGETTEGIAAGIEELRAEYTAAGRDPDTLRVRAPLPLLKGRDGMPELAATLDAAGPLYDAGVTDVHVPIVAFVRDEAGVGPWFDELASRWGRAA
jgi:probable F420-dependent oxidoreductase